MKPYALACLMLTAGACTEPLHNPASTCEERRAEVAEARDALARAQQALTQGQDAQEAVNETSQRYSEAVDAAKGCP